MFSDKPQSVKTVLRLVYDHGVFRPVEPLNIAYQDGEEVFVELLTAREQAQVRLGHLLEDISDDIDVDEMDETAVMARLHGAFTPGTMLSTSVIEERETGW